MSDFRKAPEPGDARAVMDRDYEDSSAATAENLESVATDTPENVVSVLSRTSFPFGMGENSPSVTVKWTKAGKNAQGQSRLPTKEEFEMLAEVVADARKQGKSEKNISTFLRGLGFEPGRCYWSGTEYTGHEVYAWYWCAGNAEVIDAFHKTRLKNTTKTTALYAQYIKPISV